MDQPLTLTFYRSGIRRRWRWKLAHDNGQKIAQSSQGGGFSDLRDCQHNACLTLAGSRAEIVGANAYMSPGDLRAPYRIEGREDINVVWEGR